MAGKLVLGWCCAVGVVFLASTDAAFAERLRICSGYGCYYQRSMTLNASDLVALGKIMSTGTASAAAERAAVSKAVRYFERKVTVLFGVKDQPKGEFGAARVFGQMDCIDESRNTTVLLKVLQRHGLLRFHNVGRVVSRGFFADGRYPHSTAVLREKGASRWAVDSWYEPAGGAPDIMHLAEWRKRGVGGQR